MIRSFGELTTNWMWRVVVSVVVVLLDAFYRFDERFCGGAGSTADSPIYPRVAAHCKAAMMTRVKTDARPRSAAA